MDIKKIIIKKIFLWLGIPGVLILGVLFIGAISAISISGSHKSSSGSGGGAGLIIGAGCKLTGQVDRTKFDAKINQSGAFANHADGFMKAAESAKIDPVLLAAIALHETGYGKSNAVVNKNNPGGLMDPKTNWQTLQIFSSLEEGLVYMAGNLNRLYISQGLTTIDQIGGKYAPIGADNDPGGLNKYWVPTVTKIAQELGGAMQCEVVEGGGTGEIKVDENMKGDFQFPFVGINYVVTSDYGGRWGTLHAGIDLVAYRGAPVSAVGDGKVVDARLSSSYGNMVTIQHPNGVFTRYAHMDGLNVSTGQDVKKGQQIGIQGNTGDSTGTHLHFEARRGNDYKQGTSFDPRQLLPFPPSQSANH
ncbi:peptidoglycan DD-metalloendopeptidase family protein [Bacillus sp. RM2(2019)]|uniref:peptidoglycan DD-metalloendopeptidase family protein n=1 Tax=Bacillus sp. RM2(2019) TaxID=2651636 RepID=UPI00124D4BCD|nr:peptidoglycan DD-metalloendopeptidase family protein [Bacillus sp. RM2(2019)]KAB2372804.1 peptidoglycan DD-metalloendopeptidase family protein [Bacillus sp. RM2(2019)]